MINPRSAVSTHVVRGELHGYEVRKLRELVGQGGCGIRSEQGSANGLRVQLCLDVRGKPPHSLVARQGDNMAESAQPGRIWPLAETGLTVKRQTRLMI